MTCEVSVVTILQGGSPFIVRWVSFQTMAEVECGPFRCDDLFLRRNVHYLAGGFLEKFSKTLFLKNLSMLYWCFVETNHF